MPRETPPQPPSIDPFPALEDDWQSAANPAFLRWYNEQITWINTVMPLKRSNRPRRTTLPEARPAPPIQWEVEFVNTTQPQQETPPEFIQATPAPEPIPTLNTVDIDQLLNDTENIFDEEPEPEEEQTISWGDQGSQHLAALNSETDGIAHGYNDGIKGYEYRDSSYWFGIADPTTASEPHKTKYTAW